MKIKSLLLLGSALTVLLSGLSVGNVSAAAPTGNLACMDSTTTTILIYVEFSNAGTTGANLYRYGAAAAVATYPNRSSGSGSAQDEGLSAGHSYSYELHSGSAVIARQVCSTKSAASSTPPPASPSNTSPPPSQPTQPTSTPAPSSTSPPKSTPAASPAASSSTSRAASAPAVSASGTATPEPAAVTIPTPSDKPATPEVKKQTVTHLFGGTPTKNIQPKPAADKGGTFAGLTGAGVVAIIIGAVFWLRRRNRDELAYEGVASDPLLLPLSSLPPTSPPPVPPPLLFPPTQTEIMEQRINDAFYPAQSLVTATPKPEEPQDMYQIAREYPASFGNTNYAEAPATPEEDVPLEPHAPARPSAPLEASQLHRQS